MASAGNAAPRARARDDRVVAAAGRRGVARIADDQTVLDLDNALGVARDLAVMGDQHDGVAAPMQLCQQRHHLGAAFTVERSGRLVGEDHAAAVHQRAGDGHALLLSAGKLAWAMGETIGEAKGGQKLLRTAPPFRCRGAGVHRRDFDVFDRSRGSDQVVALENESEGVAPKAGQLVGRQRRHVDALERIAAAGRPVETAEDVHQRRLARARRAHHGDELAGVDGERDAVQNLDRDVAGVVSLGESGKLDQRRRVHDSLGGRVRDCSLPVLDWRAAPMTTRSPSPRPERTCADTRLVMPTVMSRSSMPPPGVSTWTL